MPLNKEFSGKRGVESRRQVVGGMLHAAVFPKPADSPVDRQRDFPPSPANMAGLYNPVVHQGDRKPLPAMQDIVEGDFAAEVNSFEEP